jgi:GNAT superfamily N-acetyltransferase
LTDRGLDAAIWPEGVFDLPAGKIADVVTFLERFPPAPEADWPPGASLATQPRPVDVSAYRAIYRRVGEDLLWMSRAVMPDPTLAEWLNRPTTVVKFLLRGDRPVGLVELDRAMPRTTEIVSFGLVPDEIGTGIAHPLMKQVLADEFGLGAARVWLHTCTFDHPAAVPFYRRHGFVAYKRAIEVVDDPRLTGALPRDAAPQVPIIAPDTE